MSSKGRGKQSVEHDYYPTPAWCVDRLLDDCGAELLRGGGLSALEPTVGDGAICRAVDAWILRECVGVDTLAWTGVELRRKAGAADAVEWLHDGVDFRLWASTTERRFDLSMGNPPFTLAEAILRPALALSDHGAFLLRVGFMGAAERLPFFHEHPDFALRVLPNRPSFDGEGTDSATYAWFVWNCPGVAGVKVLAETPVSVRNAQKPSGLYVDPRQVSLFDGGEAA